MKSTKVQTFCTILRCRLWMLALHNDSLLHSQCTYHRPSYLRRVSSLGVLQYNGELPAVHYAIMKASDDCRTCIHNAGTWVLLDRHDVCTSGSSRCWKFCCLADINVTSLTCCTCSFTKCKSLSKVHTHEVHKQYSETGLVVSWQYGEFKASLNYYTNAFTV